MIVKKRRDSFFRKLNLGKKEIFDVDSSITNRKFIKKAFLA